MRIFSIILVSFFFLSLENPALKEVKWLVESSSKLIIDGKSNINKFRCQVDQYVGLDTLTTVYNDASRNIISLAGSIQVLAESFDCRNDMMTHDLRKTILADQYPSVKVEFLADRKNRISYGKHNAKAIIQVSLGGVCKEFDLEYSLAKSVSGSTFLKGSRKFLFSDFNLEPPTKMLGMVRVDNEFEVIFDLVLKPIG